MQKHRPVQILTGFLGSGKTTLLNRVLREEHGVRCAVIVNEFGEVGLDGDLLQQASQDFVKMDNGCLCCVLNDELVKTIAELAKRNDFDKVIVETTGVADPLPIAWPFLRQEFDERFRFAGIVTVVDCLHFEQMLQAGEETRLQIERADFLYLSKTDLATPEQLHAIQNAVVKINPNARLVQQSDPAWFDLLFGGEEKVLQPSHDHHHVDYTSMSLPIDQALSLDRVEDFFEQLPKEVFRAKAVFSDLNNRLIAMHGVCGRVDFYDLEQFKGKKALVLIGKNFDQTHLKQKWQQEVLGSNS